MMSVIAPTKAIAGCSGKRPRLRQVPDWTGIDRQMGRDGMQYHGSSNRYNSISERPDNLVPRNVLDSRGTRSWFVQSAQLRPSEGIMELRILRVVCL